MLIRRFSYRFFPPDCNPSSKKLNAIAKPAEDIREIFPYLNGVIKRCN